MIPADLLDQLREKDPELWERYKQWSAHMDIYDETALQYILQGELQEAIRARDGWGCQITSFGLPVIANVYNRREYTTGRGDTEAEALGWAYLEAIEAIRQ